MNRGIFYMLISSFAFAIMNLIVKFLPQFPPSELILFRSIVSLIISYYFIAKLNLKPFGNNKFWLVMRGLSGSIALGLFFYTLQKLPLSTAVTIQYLSPIFTAFIAIFLLGEKMPKTKWMFFAISFLGIAIVKGFSAEVTIEYLLIGIASAALSGFAYAVIRKLKSTDHPVIIVFYFPLVATPFAILFSVNVWVTPVGIEWFMLIAIGVLTQIAQIYLTKALAILEAGTATIMKYLGIVYAISFDLLLFSKSYSAFAYLGMFMVIFGVALNLLYSRYKLNRA